MLDSRQTSTIAADCENPMHIMEVCGSVLTYEPSPHDRARLTWSGPFRGLPDRMLRVTYQTADGFIGWHAAVYEPAYSLPIAEGSRINGSVEDVVLHMKRRTWQLAIKALHFLADSGLLDDYDSTDEDGPHSLCEAVKAYRDTWNAQFGEGRAAGVFGRFYDESDPRVTL